tara:strand:- start:129 stop:971 length:843 start_codon:yes stop_codon:yes gene_type:complete
MIIWIASYPKSGNTWLRSLLSTYYFTKDGNFNFQILNNIKSFPSSSYFEKYSDNFSEPESTAKYWISEQRSINLDKRIKFLKTHNALCKIDGHSFTDENNSIGAIHIVRDPRNVLTSLSNHYQIKKSDALEFMLQNRKAIVEKRDNRYLGFNPLFSWSIHEKSWSECNKFPVLTIRYEDLQLETFVTFKKVISFISKLTNKKNSFKREKAKKTISSCEFNKLKKMENEVGFNEAISSKLTGEKVKFFNLGKDNDYKKLLGKDLIEKMNSLFKEQIKKYEY